ncbi:SMI1/KNR4 family protein [Sphaerisporangium sp. NPDC088356]|uniref:SMI1/KNR4 family protein n=1 Tax=Sphaerisporangium sp. NPDC088356 TaxID=3154871 RepID=UPI0034303575
MRSLDVLEGVLDKVVGGHRLAPGLRDAEIDDLLRPSGLVLPCEVRAYLRRHDGAQPTSRVVAPWLIGHWLPLSLGEALRERDRRHAMALRDFDGDADAADDGVWAPGWLPLFRAGNGYILAVDCQADPASAGPAPLLRMARVTPTPPSLSSLEELFEFFTLALTTGAWAWDAERRRWMFDRARLSYHPLTHLL